VIICQVTITLTKSKWKPDKSKPVVVELSYDMTKLKLYNVNSKWKPCISPLEWQALENLYDSTDGPNWNYLYDAGIPWDFFNPNTNPCDELWYGITCSVDYHVVDLSLGYSNLKGTIPATIVQLSFLEYLYLQSNQLTGIIPSTIRQLFSLEYIFLYDNQLTRVVPVSPCQIHLRYNFFWVPK